MHEYSRGVLQLLSAVGVVESGGENWDGWRKGAVSVVSCSGIVFLEGLLHRFRFVSVVTAPHLGKLAAMSSRLVILEFVVVGFASGERSSVDFDHLFGRF